MSQSVPTKDGEIIHSFPDDMAMQTSDRRQIVLINGIWTPGTYFMQMAKTLANHTHRPVTGIYNLTNGRNADLMQAVMDFVLPLGSTIPDVPVPIGSEEQRFRFFHTLLSCNLAAAVLYEQIYDLMRKKWRIYVVCHSQGCLITSNVLWALKRVRFPRAIDGIYVYAHGSPAPSWPVAPGFRVRRYTNAVDPVTWFGAFENVTQPTHWKVDTYSPTHSWPRDAHAPDRSGPNGTRGGYLNWDVFLHDIQADLGQRWTIINRESQ